jgi:hypothetical protein
LLPSPRLLIAPPPDGFTGEGDTREERQGALRRDFGFVCACALCSLEGAALKASNRRQRRIRELADEIVEAGRAARTGGGEGGGSGRAGVVTLVEERLRLLQEEGLHTNWDSMAVAMRHLLASCSEGSAIAPSRDEARVWAARAAECAKMALGEDSEEYLHYRKAL